MAEHDPNAIDAMVGANIRLRRKQMGMSQGQLAEALGLTFQQVQKYELGTNRVSASKLVQIARKLKVGVASFFGAYADTTADAMAPDIDASAFLAHRHAPEIITSFLALTPRQQIRIRDLLISMADGDD